MSINSIDHNEIADVASKWDYKDETASNIAPSKRQQAEARRRIEMLRDIRDSGLTIAEAKEMGLIH
ncbi:hypothetical protein [uncultured Photobacterium sp.]|uniref:hypothetical protein n=1 Tax=uncultured Photobacterium sp. TaxID=173973 RepID=UPI00260DD83B|nr:hypothetical protein [uncultured Photobacterium sp.]